MTGTILMSTDARNTLCVVSFFVGLFIGIALIIWFICVMKRLARANDRISAALWTYLRSQKNKDSGPCGDKCPLADDELRVLKEFAADHSITIYSITKKEGMKDYNPVHYLVVWPYPTSLSKNEPFTVNIAKDGFKGLQLNHEYCADELGI